MCCYLADLISIGLSLYLSLILFHIWYLHILYILDIFPVVWRFVNSVPYFVNVHLLLKHLCQKRFFQISWLLACLYWIIDWGKNNYKGFRHLPALSLQALLMCMWKETVWYHETKLNILISNNWCKENDCSKERYK